MTTFICCTPAARQGMPKGVMYYNGEFCLGLARGGLALAGLPAPTTVEELPDLVRRAKR